MSGYIDRPREGPPLTGERIVGLVLALAGAAMMVGLAAAFGRYAPLLVELFDNSVARLAPLMWIIGGSILLGADTSADDPTIPRRTPRYRRLMAAFFFALGVAMLAAGLFI